MGLLLFLGALLGLGCDSNRDWRHPPDAGPDAGPPDTGPSPPDTGPRDGGPVGFDSGPGDVDGGPPPGSPTCTITSPDDGTTQAYDDDFTFEATATDPEDGALSGASVVWTSDVSGMLGTGLTITTTLAPGDHTITCTATDSASLTGTDSIDVTSQSPVATINHPTDMATRSIDQPRPSPSHNGTATSRRPSTGRANTSRVEIVTRSEPSRSSSSGPNLMIRPPAQVIGFMNSPKVARTNEARPYSPGETSRLIATIVTKDKARPLTPLTRLQPRRPRMERNAAGDCWFMPCRW